MKVLAVADALLPEKYMEDGVTRLASLGAEVTVLQWGEDSEAALDKRARNLELYGPTAELPSEAVEQHVADADVLIVHYCPVSERLLEKAKKLRILATCRAGLENIDIQAATRRGILTFHVVGRTTEAVSDFTVGLIIAEARNIARAHAALKNGIWRKSYVNSAFTPELEGKTVGLVGFGEIGRAVLRKLKGFNMNFLVFDPFVRETDILESGAQPADLDSLLRLSDFVSIHARLIEENKKMIGERELSLMKPTAYLINSARAGLVDEDALYRALRDHKIAGAACDVFGEEPLPQDHPFLQLDNITLTPHLASSTRECVTKSPRLLVEEMVNFFNKGTSRFIVNPEVLQRYPAEHFRVTS